jgi:hypothetical protein
MGDLYVFYNRRVGETQRLKFIDKSFDRRGAETKKTLRLRASAVIFSSASKYSNLFLPQ